MDNIIRLLFPNLDKHPSIKEIESNYPKRQLKPEAMVTRFAPSPTGFMHIGGVYAALINKQLARQSDGIFFLRIEDTDTVRSQTDAIDVIVNMLNGFDLLPDEGLVRLACESSYKEQGRYGAYIQSNRQLIYQTYVIDLLKKDLAYPCFLSSAELEEIRLQQMKQKLRPGCYGTWAKWRNADLSAIQDAINNNKNFVIRLRSSGNYKKRIYWQDLIKGELSMPENDIDIVLLKSDGLPTYHFAHVIDDYLMQTTHVIRGDEWLSSVPIHLQLFNLLSWQAPQYAHFAPIEKEENINGIISRRKLSKRKDCEANIIFYLQQGFPEEAIIIYLKNLMDSSFLQWYFSNSEKSVDDFQFSLEKFSKHGALGDIDKLKNISKEIISKMEIEELYTKSTSWALQWDKELAELMCKYPSYTKKILNIERNHLRPCKRFITWSDIRPQLFFMYDELFNKQITVSLPENCKMQ